MGPDPRVRTAPLRALSHHVTLAMPSDLPLFCLQVKERQKFFSIFYMSINTGSLLSTVITPILRSESGGSQVKYLLAHAAFL